MRSVSLLVALASVWIVSCPIASQAQAQSASATQRKAFVFVQRTDQHAKRSSSEVFHDVVSDMLDYLKSKHVVVAVDEFGGRNSAEGATPLDTVFRIARDAKATSVLYVVVDRPATKWIKITVQCFDMNQRQLWQEEASSGGGLSGKHGFDVSTKKMHALLDQHIGRDELPVSLPPQESSAVNP